MKKILIILAVALTVGMTGCKKFLDVKPVGARFLTELDAVKSTMGTWMYRLRKGSNNVIADDAPSIWLTYLYGGMYGDNPFLSYADVWSFKNMNEQDEALTESNKRVIDRTNGINHWSEYYRLIGLMNLIITEAQTANGDEELRDILLGEAYIQRAFYFLKLLQYYAPIDDAAIGIPVYLEIHSSPEEADLSRQPQSKVFDQIIKDFNEAEKRLARTKPSETFNIMYNADWIYRIGAQIYLWKASSAVAEETDWENAAKYADLALKAANTDKPADFETLQTEILCGGTVWGGLGLGDGYPETLGIATDYNSSNMSNRYNYKINVWKELYKIGDKRKMEWFLEEQLWEQAKNDPESIAESDISCSRKTKYSSTAYAYPCTFLLRLSETYLIRIEALAMSNDIPGAQAALSTWRSLRYDNQESLAMPATAEEIQHECYLERKREFLGEADIIWLDMKRFHISETRNVKDFTATLDGNDFRYQFEIPADEIKYNPDIITNPGWSGVAY